MLFHYNIYLERHGCSFGGKNPWIRSIQVLCAKLSWNWPCGYGEEEAYGSGELKKHNSWGQYSRDANITFILKILKTIEFSESNKPKWTLGSHALSKYGFCWFIMILELSNLCRYIMEKTQNLQGLTNIHWQMVKTILKVSRQS